jgi:hypothetical protein
MPLENSSLVMEWTIVELAEALVLIGVFQRDLVGKVEEEESKRLSRYEVKAWLLD